MPEFSVEIQDARVQAALTKLQGEMSGLQPMLEEIGAELKKKVQLNFRSSTSPDGKPWAPPKARQGKPLVDKGRLRNSIDYQVDRDSVTIGTNLVYAALQNFGGVIKPKNGKALSFVVGGRRVFVKHAITIPAREFLPTSGLPASWSNSILKIISRRLQDAANLGN